MIRKIVKQRFFISSFLRIAQLLHPLEIINFTRGLVAFSLSFSASYAKADFLTYFYIIGPLCATSGKVVIEWPREVSMVWESSCLCSGVNISNCQTEEILTRERTSFLKAAVLKVYLYLLSPWDLSEMQILIQGVCPGAWDSAFLLRFPALDHIVRIIESRVKSGIDKLELFSLDLKFLLQFSENK